MVGGCAWIRFELLKQDWQNVDLDRGFVTFRKTKNGEDRSVRLTDRAKRVLTDLDLQENGPVLTYRGQTMKDVKTSFERARTRAGGKIAAFTICVTPSPHVSFNRASRSMGCDAPDRAQKLRNGATLRTLGSGLPTTGNRGLKRLWHSFGTVSLNGVR